MPIATAHIDPLSQGRTGDCRTRKSCQLVGPVAALLTIACLILTLLGTGCGRDDGGQSLLQRARGGELPADGLTYGGVLMDLDQNGWLDLLMSRHGDRAEAYLNRGGLQFSRAPETVLLPGQLRDQHGLAACDYDRDGDCDVFITIGAEHGLVLAHNQLWRQEKPGRFVDVAAGNSLLTDPVGRGRGAIWADFDGNRWPDLLLINYKSQARLLMWSGRLWSAATDWFPTPPEVALWQPGMPPLTAAERERSTWIHAAVVADFDLDGRPDLLAIGLQGWSGMWRNTGQGRFQDLTSAWGLKPALWPHVPSHGCAGDVDHDGDPDLVVLYREPTMHQKLDRGQIELWLNQEGPYGRQFRNVGPESGLTAGEVLEAGLLGDLDCDGHLDLYVVQNGRNGELAANLIFLGDGTGRFRQLPGGAESDPPPGQSESAVLADLDCDGDLDVLAFNGAGTDRSSGGGVVLYENRSSRLKGFTLELVSKVGAPHGLGARVSLKLPEHASWREVTSRADPFSSSILPVHFGVGPRQGPFSVTILWASGRGQNVSIPRAGSAYRVQEGDSEVLELSGSPPKK